MKQKIKLEKISNDLFQDDILSDGDQQMMFGGTCTSVTYTTTTSCGCTKTDVDSCGDLEA